MHHAGLTMVSGQMVVMASGRPVSPSQQAISGSREPAVAELGEHPSQNFAPSPLVCIQIPSTCLKPSTSTPTTRWATLMRDRAAVADFDPHAVDEHDRIHLIDRAGLPGADLIDDRHR